MGNLTSRPDDLCFIFPYDACYWSRAGKILWRRQIEIFGVWFVYTQTICLPRDTRGNPTVRDNPDVVFSLANVRTNVGKKVIVLSMDKHETQHVFIWIV